MPRLARLDAPGILHHVISRGIEKRKIFIDNTDRNDFIDRLSALVQDGAMEIYAWALIPNHFSSALQNKKISSGIKYAENFNRLCCKF
jgi:REP element-mobilizing transposase RayT